MKKLKFVCMFLSIILLLTVELQAYTVELVESQTEITAGDKIVMSVNLEDLEEKIDTYQGTLVYSKSYFNSVTESCFALKNGWNGLVYNAENGIFVVERSTKTDASEEILTITLEAK